MRKILLFLFLLLFISCDEDTPVEPKLSMTEEINEARPIDRITINYTDGTYTTFDSDAFEDAYARDGYLIVKIRDSMLYYYNLSTASKVYINTEYSNTIQINY